MTPPDNLPHAAADAAPPPESRRRRWVRRTILVLLGLAVIGAVAWIARPPAEKPARGGRFSMRTAMPVVPATVTAGDMPITVDALGTVTPLATVTVRPRIAGQLIRVGFEEGQTVAAGDFLAEIDPRPYQAALDQAEGQLARDRALLAGAKTDLARYRRLLAQDSIARQQADTQEALVRQYEGTVQADLASVETAKLNLGYCRITAPIAGRVGLRQVDPGNYVQTGDTNGIVVITQMQPISVVFAIPQDRLQSVLARVRAGATLPVAAYDRAKTQVLANGTLSTVDNQVDTSTGTVKMRARFDNADGVLFPNQFVNVTMTVDVMHGAPLVPVAAIQRGAGSNFVFAIQPDSTVKPVQVTLGPGDGTSVVLAKGPPVGMQVVVDGADRLKDGAKVILPGAGPAGRPGGRPGARSGGQAGPQAGQQASPQAGTAHPGDQTGAAPQRRRRAEQGATQ